MSWLGPKGAEEQYSLFGDAFADTFRMSHCQDEEMAGGGRRLSRKSHDSPVPMEMDPFIDMDVLMSEFSDTLFSTLASHQPIAWPNPREIGEQSPPLSPPQLAMELTAISSCCTHLATTPTHSNCRRPCSLSVIRIHTEYTVYNACHKDAHCLQCPLLGVAQLTKPMVWSVSQFKGD